MQKDTMRVTAAKFLKSFGTMSEATLLEPIVITRQGRVHLVVLTADEFKRLKRRDRAVYAAGELRDELLEAISSSQMDPRHDHLNALLDN